MAMVLIASLMGGYLVLGQHTHISGHQDQRHAAHARR